MNYYSDHLVSSALSFIGEVKISAKALLDINLIWFGYITRLSQWGGWGYSFKSFLPAFATLRKGGRVVSTL
jgi:hypothetical protein